MQDKTKRIPFDSAGNKGIPMKPKYLIITMENNIE